MRLTGSVLPAVPFREALVDLGAIRRNSARCAARVGGLIADLGADAFGHGALACAPSVVDGGARAIIVPRITEALALRRSGIEVPIVASIALDDDDQVLSAAVAEDVVVVAASTPDLERVLAAGAKTAGARLETGAGLPGIAAGDLAQWSPALWLVAALPPASAASRDAAERALDAALGTGIRFAEVVVDGSGTAHAGATLCSSGEALFGLEADATRGDATEAAMTLWAPVVALKPVDADVGVSYGFTYRTPVASTLALVSLGYGDGVDRASGNAGPVAIGGRRYRVAGRVAMDAFVVDLGTDPLPQIGDPAVLFGDPEAGHPAVAEWAEALKTTPAEITARLTARVRRSYA